MLFLLQPLKLIFYLLASVQLCYFDKLNLLHTFRFMVPSEMTVVSSGLFGGVNPLRLALIPVWVCQHLSHQVKVDQVSLTSSPFSDCCL